MSDLRAKYVVGLAFHFGIRPWEIDLLTVNEFYSFCDACDHLNKEASP